jgi:hypothetical protein
MCVKSAYGKKKPVYLRSFFTWVFLVVPISAGECQVHRSLYGDYYAVLMGDTRLIFKIFWIPSQPSPLFLNQK